MAEFPRTATANPDVSASKINTDKISYWRKMLKSYERRNASLEKRHSALVERVRFMECTLPSLLMGLAASTTCSEREGRDKRRESPEITSKSAAQRT
ncbi:hypothetical protein PUN28_001034 [Cardiocondyla obscurior]|uniref:Uncharacterized protein n=1 Tax=Cardiocondyla obscurior TaxID=286306 RepID=A0AAW2H2K7_9HYME